MTLTTVVAEADERFGKAYLRWASPVAISEIKPDLREIQEDFFFIEIKVATCFHCTARPASQAEVAEVGKKLAKDYRHHPYQQAIHHINHEIWMLNSHKLFLVATR